MQSGLSASRSTSSIQKNLKSGKILKLKNKTKDLWFIGFMHLPIQIRIKTKLKADFQVQVLRLILNMILIPYLSYTFNV